MGFPMTPSTSRQNIKPMLRGVAKIMMVLLSRLRTVMAKFGIRSGQFANSNGVIYSVTCFNIMWIASAKTFCSSISSKFAFFCLAMAFSCGFAFYAFIVFLTRLLFCSSIGFRYDLFSHILFLYKRLRLEPVAGYNCGRLVLLYKINTLRQQNFQ